jgi:cell division cycle protein 37
MLSKWDDCKRYLMENPVLCCEETTNYLTIWCLDLQIEDKSELMHHISKQVISLQYILELAKQLECDPRSCISSFFNRIQVAEREYMSAYEDELKSFRARIQDRARARIEAVMKEVEEEEREKRLGPGGLDPIEVMETLPESLRDCFEKKDIPLLHATLAKMEHKEAAYHMKRCVDSGLWVAGADKDDDPEAESDEDAESTEQVYESVDKVEPSLETASS